MTRTLSCTKRVMLLGAAVVALFPGIVEAQLDDLKLYGVSLRTAKVTEFVKAATGSGVRALTRVPGENSIVEFDASGAGVPGLRRFDLMRQSDDVIAVRFHLSHDPDVDEQLRKMLEAKYGPPNRDRGGSYKPAEFSGRYFRGRAHWPFAGQMALIYSRPFMDGAYLTYLNEVRFEQAMAAAAAQASSSAQTNAKQLREKF